METDSHRDTIEEGGSAHYCPPCSAVARDWVPWPCEVAAQPVFMDDNPTSAFHADDCRCSGHCGRQYRAWLVIAERLQTQVL